MKRIISAITIAAATLAGPALAEQYVCQMEQAVGFTKLDSGEWQDVRFSDRYSFLVDTETFLVTEFGKPDLPPMTCIGGSLLATETVWPCSTVTSSRALIFNETSLRFTYSAPFGYAGGDLLADPFLGIGTCAKLGG